MKIVKKAIAGTLESSDLLVKVAPGKRALWTLSSKVKSSSSSANKSDAWSAETLSQARRQRGTVTIEDKGASDYAIGQDPGCRSARRRTEEVNWGQLS